MHHSRVSAFVLDCQVDDLTTATDFWSKALGRSGRQRRPGRRRQVRRTEDRCRRAIPAAAESRARAAHPSGHRDRRPRRRSRAPRSARRDARRVRQALVGHAGADRPSLLRRAQAAAGVRVASEYLGLTDRKPAGRPACESAWRLNRWARFCIKITRHSPRRTLMHSFLRLRRRRDGRAAVSPATHLQPR